MTGALPCRGIPWESTADAAHRWGVSEPLVRRLCRAGRVHGAFFFSRRWLIPVGAAKPPAGR